jgi:hypothetical protein
LEGFIYKVRRVKRIWNLAKDLKSSEQPLLEQNDYNLWHLKGMCNRKTIDLNNKVII